MARSAKLKNSAAALQKGGFIECELDEDERAACREWWSVPETRENALQAIVDAKYQVKVSYDPSNDCYVCYITGHWKLNKPDADWTLTGRGSTVDRALGQGLYKHFEVLGGSWEQNKTHPKREQNWD